MKVEQLNRLDTYGLGQTVVRFEHGGSPVWVDDRITAQHRRGSICSQRAHTVTAQLRYPRP